jgi:tripartite-type tricarboxylate transporter receptor subunit TctC
MRKRHLLIWAAGLLLVTPGLVAQYAWSGSSWPERSVRIITPFNPGISPDAAARTFADAFGKAWKQPVIVENRPGADTMLGTQAFLQAGDNHALLFTTHSTFTVIPLLHAKVSYDPVADMRPISLAVEDYIGVVAPPSLKINSLPEFVELARQTPAKLNFYAAPGSPYLAYLAFAKRAQIETTFVPYNSPVSAVSDLSEGRIHVAVLPLASVLGAIQGGKMKLLAVTNAERSPAAPDVPTVGEQGYQDFTFGGFLGFFAPKEMPLEMRNRIASDVQNALKNGDVKQSD